MADLTENEAFLAGRITPRDVRPRLFFPCAVRRLPLKTFLVTAACPTRGSVVGQSAAILNFALFRNNQRQGKRFCSAMETTGRGAAGGHPNIQDSLRQDSNEDRKSPAEFAPEFCEGKLRSKTLQPNLNERTRIAPPQ